MKLSGECFSTVVSETRPSTSTAATLKDVVIGSFSSCQPTLTTAVQRLDATRTVSPGTAVHDRATITVTGATNPEDGTRTVDFSLCGPGTSANPSCAAGGTAAGTDEALVDTSSPANTHDGISGPTPTTSIVEAAGSP